MLDKAELTIIADNSGMERGYLVRTDKGEAVFSRDLALAATYSSPRAQRNAVSRIKGAFEIKYLKATLEVVPW